jgi:hypothetical protein
MNYTDSLKKTLEEVNAEINRLINVRDDLDRLIAGGGAGVTPVASIRPSGNAPKGALKEAILAALKKAKEPISPQDIRAQIKASGYVHSLNPTHVSKYLFEMANEDKTVKRSGVGRASKYALK